MLKKLVPILFMLMLWIAILFQILRSAMFVRALKTITTTVLDVHLMIRIHSNTYLNSLGRS